jgi:ubiquinone/menaquinone biosynthesis C-methylase UbiE
MLKLFQQWVISVKAENIELAKANVFDANSLPAGWNNFDTIISIITLKYLPRDKAKDALSNLNSMLKPEGSTVVIIAKHNLLTALIGSIWWKADLYKKPKIRQAFVEITFKNIEFRKFNPWMVKRHHCNREEKNTNAAR